jgi:hypothetical protein
MMEYKNRYDRREISGSTIRNYVKVVSFSLYEMPNSRYIIIQYLVAMETPIKYYDLKYGDNVDSAFIHLVRETGQIAYALETQNKPVLAAKIIEAIALLRFLAYKHSVEIESNMENIYSKKLAQKSNKMVENQ